MDYQVKKFVVKLRVSSSNRPCTVLGVFPHQHPHLRMPLRMPLWQLAQDFTKRLAAYRRRPAKRLTERVIARADMLCLLYPRTAGALSTELS